MELVPRQRCEAADQIDFEEEVVLLTRARSCPEAFTPLYQRYFSRVYAYCWRRVGHAQEAEDLTSIVFTRALIGLASYRSGSVAAWLFRIARNTVIDYLRRDRPSLSLDADLVHPALSLGVPHDPTLDQLVDAEARAQVAHLIAALPEEQREILALTVAGGLSAREVGAVVGKSEGAVWTALHRITRRLRDAYQGTMGEVS